MATSTLNIAHQRLFSQRLTGTRLIDAADVVRWLGAVQSQDYAGAKWGLAVRMADTITDAAVDEAFNAGRLVRTHVLRPTWHFVAPEDLRWLVALTGPRVQAANAGVYRRLELDDVVLRRARHTITQALRDQRYRTRSELGEALAARKIAATGQRLAHIMMHCELDGVICSGPLRGGKHTYALVEERIPPTPKRKRDEALAELARRYFTSHGPATAHDFAWWSGLTVQDARRGAQLADADLQTVALAGRTYWLSPAAAGDAIQLPVMHLLPNYDEHVVAYRDHAPSLDPRAPDALAGWGNAQTTHLVARNGLVVGGWRRMLDGDHVTVRVRLHTPLKAAETRALRKAAAEYGSFSGRTAILEDA
jgi:hypothetical protein